MNFIKFLLRNKSTEDICAKYGIWAYDINNDNELIVDENVSFTHKSLTEIPLKFYSVKGYFDLSFNKLKSLKNSPKYAYNNFACEYNKLKILEYSPKYVYGDYSFVYNINILSVNGITNNINGDVYHHGTKFSSIVTLFCNYPTYKEYQEIYNFHRGNKIIKHRLQEALIDFGYEGIFPNIRFYKCI